MISITSALIFKNRSIAVLMGGPGAEKEVSLSSGGAVFQALRREGVSVVACEVDTPEEVLSELPENVDFVFNMIHGEFGEDGQLQSFLDEHQIPYSGEGAKASRLAFHKKDAKAAFRAAGVPTPSGQILKQGQFPTIEPPFVIKPASQGSALGVHIIRQGDEELIRKAVREAFLYDQELLVEPYIEGKELTVGILGESPLPVIEICPKEGFYDYEHKYTKGRTKYLVPAPLPDDLYYQAQEVALAAHQALGLSVYSRVDILLSEKEGFFVLEANTIPGMTETSLLPQAARAVGVDFSTLCATIMKLSLEKKSPLLAS